MRALLYHKPYLKFIMFFYALLKPKMGRQLEKLKEKKEEKWICLNPRCGKEFTPYIVDNVHGRPIYSTICKKCRKELDKEAEKT